MSVLLDWAGAALVLAGTVLTTLGTIGLLRFPDLLTRLHALTKADNAGLGLCVVGLILLGRDASDAGLMLLIWVGVMLCGATSAFIVARAYLRREEQS